MQHCIVGTKDQYWSWEKLVTVEIASVRELERILRKLEVIQSKVLMNETRLKGMQIAGLPKSLHGPYTKFFGFYS